MPKNLKYGGVGYEDYMKQQFEGCALNPSMFYDQDQYEQLANGEALPFLMGREAKNEQELAQWIMSMTVLYVGEDCQKLVKDKKEELGEETRRRNQAREAGRDVLRQINRPLSISGEEKKRLQELDRNPDAELQTNRTIYGNDYSILKETQAQVQSNKEDLLFRASDNMNFFSGDLTDLLESEQARDGLQKNLSRAHQFSRRMMDGLKQKHEMNELLRNVSETSNAIRRGVDDSADETLESLLSGRNRQKLAKYDRKHWDKIKEHLDTFRAHSSKEGLMDGYFGCMAYDAEGRPQTMEQVGKLKKGEEFFLPSGDRPGEMERFKVAGSEEAPRYEKVPFRKGGGEKTISQVNFNVAKETVEQLYRGLKGAELTLRGSKNYDNIVKSMAKLRQQVNRMAAGTDEKGNALSVSDRDALLADISVSANEAAEKAEIYLTTKMNNIWNGKDKHGANADKRLNIANAVTRSLRGGLCDVLNMKDVTAEMRQQSLGGTERESHFAGLDLRTAVIMDQPEQRGTEKKPEKEVEKEKDLKDIDIHAAFFG